MAGLVGREPMWGVITGKGEANAMGRNTVEVHIPPDLLAQVREAAEEEHRTADDLNGDALEGYLKERNWRRLVTYGREQARKLGYTEEDMPRLIDEYRQEHKGR